MTVGIVFDDQIPVLNTLILTWCFWVEGTFHSRDRMRDVIEFVRGCLVSDWQPFFLSETCGQLTNEDAVLSDLGLVSWRTRVTSVGLPAG